MHLEVCVWWAVNSGKRLLGMRESVFDRAERARDAHWAVKVGSSLMFVFCVKVIIFYECVVFSSLLFCLLFWHSF